jgi:hypothetical protein
VSRGHERFGGAEKTGGKHHNQQNITSHHDRYPSVMRFPGKLIFLGSNNRVCPMQKKGVVQGSDLRSLDNNNKSTAVKTPAKVLKRDAGILTHMQSVSGDAASNVIAYGVCRISPSIDLFYFTKTTPFKHMEKSL